ncbi:MAG: hypothetical protein ABJF04_06905 [Reichenbachiella sp.]|uniref:hypothetical protein n=1 Tax=Reichenbachiella sp. TaxID=2184521 RepID=UPI003264FC60
MRNLILTLMFLQVGCQKLQKEEIEGLWQLSQVKIDGMLRPQDATYLRIDKNNSFAVSRTSGDMSGVYQLGATRIHFQGKDKSWFNTSWTLKRLEDYLMMEGVEFGFRVTELKFKKVEKIPDFEDFEKQVVGKWQLYLVMKEGIPEKVANTWITIDDDGAYTIYDDTGIQDQGRSIINTRHRKVIFVKDNMHWDVWFWGEELRLQNQQLDIQYHLKKNA